jgi:predicted regulator of Ras-like GTPase activity (Roadblock/LC7/MglB family)
VNFENTLSDLVVACPGALGAAIVDPDGIPLAFAPDKDPALEVLGAELSSILRDIDQAGRELDHGPLHQLSVSAESATVVVTTTGGGYFIVLVLSPDGVAGRARFLYRLTGERLYSEFI